MSHREGKKKRLTPLQSAEVVQTGRISFNGCGIQTFRQIDIPDVAIRLDISNNSISDFSGFEPSSSLETLILDNNLLLSFSGFPQQQCIKHFSAKGTPIAQLPNYRQIAILAIGSILETIDGVEISANERKETSSATLGEYFNRRTSSKKISEVQQSNLLSKLSDCFRKGYICDSLPRKLKEIEEASDKYENDSMTVRAMRLMKILKRDEVSIDELMDKLFGAPVVKKSRPQITVTDERLTRQQALINFMAAQLHEMKEAHEQKLSELENADKKKSKKQVEGPRISESTRMAFDEMLQNNAQILLESDEIVNQQDKKSGKDYKGLRAAVIRLLEVDKSYSDRKLAQILRKRAAELDELDMSENHE